MPASRREQSQHTKALIQSNKFFRVGGHGDHQGHSLLPQLAQEPFCAAFSQKACQVGRSRGRAIPPASESWPRWLDGAPLLLGSRSSPGPRWCAGSHGPSSCGMSALPALSGNGPKKGGSLCSQALLALALWLGCLQPPLLLLELTRQQVGTRPHPPKEKKLAS